MTLLNSIDLIKCPVITDKTTKLLELNQYSFIVDLRSTKQQIKTSIEGIFNVKVISVNTLVPPIKTKRVGKFTGSKSLYKRAVVTLAAGNSINLFTDS